MRAFGLHRLHAQRFADCRVAEGPHPLLHRLSHDRVPGRHALEHGRRADHVLVFQAIQPLPQVEDRPRGRGEARAVGPDARLEGLC